MSMYLSRLLLALLLVCMFSRVYLANAFQIDVKTAALERYRQIDAHGGWPSIPDGLALQLGSHSERVLALRHRLQVTGDLPPLDQLTQINSRAAFDAAMQFDHEVDQAVRRIQRRHGLHVDGIVGRKTLDALNIPVEERLQQLQHNLEYPHPPEDLGDRYILVNIPDFTLRLIDQDRELWTTRVVVGKRQWRTPTMRSTIDSLIVNPYWHVPSRIARREVLPRVVANPQFLSEQRMEVVAPSGQVLDPTSIDWTAIDPHHFPYRIRQRPGAHNALGRVKFHFPNEYQVYLHDTPLQGLFDRAERAFSHGCVRVEKPFELAAYLLREHENVRWTPEQVEQVARQGKQTYIKLPQPIDVHFVYRTAWVEDDGTVQFRSDIYQHGNPLPDDRQIPEQASREVALEEQ